MVCGKDVRYHGMAAVRVQRGCSGVAPPSPGRAGARCHGCGSIGEGCGDRRPPLRYSLKNASSKVMRLHIVEWATALRADLMIPKVY